MTSDKRSLREIVGDEVYDAWVDMVRTLAPGGRTHRLGTLVAAMLRYSAARSFESSAGSPEAGSLAFSLLAAEEAVDSEEARDQILDVVESLFADAGVAQQRVDRRGDPYSVVEAAIHEFVHWHDMRWER